MQREQAGEAITRASGAPLNEAIRATTLIAALQVRVPCFSSSHPPDPHSFSPVLSTSRCTGAEPGRGRAISSASARRLRVE